MIEYFESRSHSYREKSQRGLWAQVRRREFAAVSQLLDPQPGQSLIDLGSGAGHYAVQLQERFAMQVLAVDSSPGMLRDLSTAHVKTWLGKVEDLPVHRQFERTLAAGLLEFVADPALVLRKCAELTEPGGKLVLLVPTAGVSGLIYKTAHQLRGCPVSIRAPEKYIELSEACGFSFAARENCTPMSVALGFSREGSGSQVTI